MFSSVLMLKSGSVSIGFNLINLYLIVFSSVLMLKSGSVSIGFNLINLYLIVFSTVLILTLIFHRHCNCLKIKNRY